MLLRAPAKSLEGDGMKIDVLLFTYLLGPFEKLKRYLESEKLKIRLFLNKRNAIVLGIIQGGNQVYNNLRGVSNFNSSNLMMFLIGSHVIIRLKER